MRNAIIHLRVALAYLVLLVGLCASGMAQSHTLRGYIEDAETGERLLGANLFDSETLLGATTNNYGFFSYTYTTDTLHLLVSYIGYQSLDTTFIGPQSSEIMLQLSTGSQLATVEISATEQTERIDEQVQMSKVEVPIEQIKRAPALFGETDVLKSLQLLPGVSGGTEGTAGLYVRGGSPDQNLVLLDGVPVYNVSHVLGIFSVFNADAINNVSLTKGGFPARYGGRLSSVLEINMKDGHKDRWQGEGGIGLISSRLTLNGPVGDKTRVLISGRRTYIDLIAKPFIALANSSNPDFKTKLQLNFYDLNTKIRHELNEEHTLYFSGYLGGDVFGTSFEDNFGGATDEYGAGVRWGNKIAALRWNWELGPRLFLNTTGTFSDYAIKFRSEYEYSFEEEREHYLAEYRSGIRDYGLKADLSFLPNPYHSVRAGFGLTHHTYTPGILSQSERAAGIAQDTTLGAFIEDGLEAWVYLEDEIRLSPKLLVNVGLHASGFSNQTLYTSLQPRLAARYRLDNGLALKASYAQMTQFVNLLTSEALALPTDLWVPSNAQVAPQRAWQAAAGIAATVGGGYELSAETFYKQMHNVISYRPGSSFFDFRIGDSWESKITQGDGESYGIELLAQKKLGETTGWIGYTLSWNNRTFADINGGQTFPYRYDRRHDISILATHKLTERIILSGAWVFGTGNAVTLPELQQNGNYATQTYTYRNPQTNELNRYQGIGFTPVEQGRGKNQYRLSNYHRFDINVEFVKQKKWGERAWIVGAYNAYWHKNPYIILARDQYNEQTQQRERVIQEVSILPIIPSISYRFKF